jgi:DNA-binding beta-propeller fold protein YncE
MTRTVWPRVRADTVATGSFPTGIAVDAAGGKVYWADNETDSITRANLDGSSPEVVYRSSDPYSNPNGIAIDHDAGKLFWTESNVVKCAGLEGSSPAVLYTASFPTGVSVASGKVFFTDNMTGSMSRGDYAGDAPTVFTLSTDAFSNPSAVAIAGDVFWAEAGGVYRMAQDGSARVQLATPAFPGGVAIEPASHRIYYTDNIDDTVSYVSADGSGRTAVYKATDAFSNPRGVAIRPE